jgi:hypothetical protein
MLQFIMFYSMVAVVCAEDYFWTNRTLSSIPSSRNGTEYGDSGSFTKEERGASFVFVASLILFALYGLHVQRKKNIARKNNALLYGECEDVHSSDYGYGSTDVDDDMENGSRQG